MPNASNSASLGTPRDPLNMGSTLRMPVSTVNTATKPDPAFKRDIIALFKKEKGGHTSRWTYTSRGRDGHQPSGSQLWSQFIAAHNNYYIPHQEQALIQYALPILKEKFKTADTLVDLGSGNAFAVRNKIAPIFNSLPEMHYYIPIDISAELLDGAKEEAESQLKEGTDVYAVNGDFYRDKLAYNGRGPILFPENSQKRAAVMFGATISNMNMTLEDVFTKKYIIEKIQEVGALLKKGTNEPAMLALSFDSNYDGLMTSALEAYNDIHWKRMIVGLMIDVRDITKGGFDPLAWHHEAIPDPANFVIHQCVVADKSQSFYIGNEYFQIRKGDKFVVVNNIKYPMPLMEQLITEAGYTADAPVTMDNNHMVIQTMTIP